MSARLTERTLRIAPDGALLRVQCAEPGGVPLALACARELAERRATEAGPRALPDGSCVWLKAAPLSPSGARRHGRARWLGRSAPRLRELAHLAWLAARLFRVPRPRFAAAAYRGAELAHQLLATEAVPGARPFGSDGSDWRDLELARELGAELGRMHALGFLHGDVYPRNVLVAPPEFAAPPLVEPLAGVPHGAPAAGADPRGGADVQDPREDRQEKTRGEAQGEAQEEAREGSERPAVGGRRLVWLDCWAGGPGHGDRSPWRPLARDLGTWFATAAERWGTDEAAAFCAAYGGARAANGRPVREPRALLAAAVRERRRELARIEREPRRAGPAGPPRAGWEPPRALYAALGAGSGAAS